MKSTLFDVLCCPTTHKPLEDVPARTLLALNRAAARGELTRRDGRTVTSEFAGGLATTDGRIFYPVIDGIPVLLEDESVLLAQLDGIQ